MTTIMKLVLILWYSAFCTLLLTQCAICKKVRKNRGIRWWKLALAPRNKSPDLRSAPSFANKNYNYLSKKQRRLVLERHTGTMLPIVKAAKRALSQCGYQFRNRQWNCTFNRNATSPNSPLFGKLLKKGCRETAFLYAITSAALTYEVARACQLGSIYSCKCRRRTYYTKKTPSANSKQQQTPTVWRGCDDDAKFASRFTEKFTGVANRAGDLRSIMNRHNGQVGRLVVSNSLERQCKCHGLSGSCTLKTCWNKMKSFRTIATQLRSKFDGASKVIQANHGSSGRTPIRKTPIIPANPSHKQPQKTDLIFYEIYHFCKKINPSAGQYGTAGRTCNGTSLGLDSCDILCCGGRFTSKMVTVVERCKCKFVWCCKVECETCRRQVKQYKCI